MGDQLMTGKQVATRLNVSYQFVREHQTELGAIILGGSKKRAGRLRFQPEAIESYINSRATNRRPNETAPGAQPTRLAG